jgi:hypothetical protein
MARAGYTDPPVSFEFGFYDDEDGPMGLSNVIISPTGNLNGPGSITIRGVARIQISRFMAYKDSRSLKVTAYGRGHPLNDDPDLVFHVFGARPVDGKVAPIKWDATDSSVLYMEVSIPYDSMVVTTSALIEQLAAQA